MMAFTNCVHVNVDIDPHFIGTCNKAAAKQSAKYGLDADLAESNSFYWLAVVFVEGFVGSFGFGP